jgi:predicted MFS family arabinose efflux permease
LATRLAQPGRTGAALAAVALGLTASAVLGVPFGTLLGQHLGWRATFWLVTLTSAVAMLLLLIRRPPAAADGADSPVPGILARFAPLVERPVMAALLPGLLWNTANMTSYTYLGAALGEHHRSNVVVILFLVYGLGGLAGSQLGGRLVDRFGAARPLLLCLALAAINQALLGIASSNVVTLGIALMVWSVTGWCTFAPQQSRLIAIAPRSAPLVIALYHSTIYVGAAAGAALGGTLIANGLHPTQLHWVTAVLLAASIGALGVSAS